MQIAWRDWILDAGRSRSQWGIGFNAAHMRFGPRHWALHLDVMLGRRVYLSLEYYHYEQGEPSINA